MQEMMKDPNQPNHQSPHQDGPEIDDLFGKIFGIERAHILKKSDRLIDVIEKITIAPENKLLFIEENNPIVSANGQSSSFSISNILTLGDLITYLCTSQHV